MIDWSFQVDPLVSLMMVEKVPDSTYEMVGGLDKQIKEIKEVILKIHIDVDPYPGSAFKKMDLKLLFFLFANIFLALTFFYSFLIFPQSSKFILYILHVLKYS